MNSIKYEVLVPLSSHELLHAAAWQLGRFTVPRRGPGPPGVRCVSPHLPSGLPCFHPPVCPSLSGYTAQPQRLASQEGSPLFCWGFTHGQTAVPSCSAVWLRRRSSLEHLYCPSCIFQPRDAAYDSQGPLGPTWSRHCLSLSLPPSWTWCQPYLQLILCPSLHPI